MPEHDTFDLDAAFAQLEHDVAGTSSPRGAGAAIATARSRRLRTTVAGVAATAVVVAGIAVAAALGGGHDRALEPVDGLPAPAPLDGPHLTAATEGWTGAWTADTAAARRQLQQTFGGPCSFALGTAAHPTEANGLAVLGTDDNDLAFAMMGDFGARIDDAQASWRQVERQIAHCNGARRLSSFDDPSGAQGQTFQVEPNSLDIPSTYVWIDMTGHGVGVLTIQGAPTDLPSANVQGVARALLAAIQDPKTYVQPSLSASSSPSQSVPSGFVSGTDFAAAVGSWSSGWSLNSGQRAADGLPCSAPDGGPSFGQQTTLGSNGDQELYGYDSPREAAAAVRLMLASLKACPDATYDVRRVSLPFGGPAVTVVSATGNDADVVWLTRVGRRVFAVIVPDGDTPPPTQVSRQVGGLVLDALHGVSEHP